MSDQNHVGPDGRLSDDFFAHLGQLSPLVASVAAEFIGTTDGRDPSVVGRTMASLGLAEQEKRATFAADVPPWHPLFWELHVGRKHGTFRCPATVAGDTQFQVISPLAFLLAVYDQGPADGDLVRVRIVLNGGESSRTYRWPEQLSTLAALGEAVSVDLDPILARPTSGQGLAMCNVGWLGKVAHNVEHGPPLWRWPRARVSVDRRGVSIQVGWHLTVHGFHWFTPSWLRGAHAMTADGTHPGTSP